MDSTQDVIDVVDVIPEIQHKQNEFNITIPIISHEIDSASPKTCDWGLKHDKSGNLLLHATIGEECAFIMPVDLQRQTMFGGHKKSDRGLKYEIKIVDYMVSYPQRPERADLPDIPDSHYRPSDDFIVKSVWKFTTELYEKVYVQDDHTYIILNRYTITAFSENCRLSTSQIYNLLGQYLIKDKQKEPSIQSKKVYFNKRPIVYHIFEPSGLYTMKKTRFVPDTIAEMDLQNCNVVENISEHPLLND
jgi:hypothetical protein